MSKNETFMENNNSNSRIPKLRFPGFTGEWEERSFGELYKKHIVKNDLSFGVDKIISVANMYYKNDANVSNDDYLRTYNVFRLGDIAYEGNKNANYAYGRFVENTIGDGIVSHVFDVYSPISPNHCLAFWKYAINYERIMRPVLEKSTIKSTMMTNLIAKDFLKQKILVPPTLAEQQKIASCLSELDNLISAQDQKVDALKEKKKGLMQQLFPQPGETTPRLRFPGFTGDWEEKKFEKCFDIGNGRDYKHLSKGNIPVYGSGGYMCSVNDYLFDGDSACIGRKGTINNPLLLHGKFWTVDTLFYTYNYVDTSAYFIYLLFQNIDWMKHNEAGGVPSLSKSIINNISVMLPEPNEQQMIVECLSQLEDLIAAESNKLEALKNHKKGLMQQLFPQPAK